ncbi:MFS transporter [soil metagenome]
MRRGQVRRLSGSALAVFSSPMIVFQAIEVPWRIYMPAFLVAHVGLSLAAVAALMFWIRLLDTVADPCVGIASDRIATRFGRRRPWMVAAVPLILLGASHMFFAPPGQGLVAIGLWAALLHLGYTMLIVPHGGWGLELARTQAERTRIMGAKMWVFAAGVPLTLAIPSIVERLLGGGLEAQVGAMGWLVLIAAPLTVIATVSFIEEPHRALPGCETTPWSLYRLGRAVTRPAMLRILMLYAMLGAADAAEGATTFFFIEQVLALPGWTATLLLAPSLVGPVTLPLWTAFGIRADKRVALAWAFGLRALIAPLAWVLPVGNMPLLCVYLVARSLCWGADYLLLRAMVADLVGEQAETTGESHAASHYALFNVANKLAAAIGVTGALGLLAAIGFAPGDGAAGAIAPYIRLLYALPSCVAGLFGLLVLRRMRAIG